MRTVSFALVLHCLLAIVVPAAAKTVTHVADGRLLAVGPHDEVYVASGDRVSRVDGNGTTQIIDGDGDGTHGLIGVAALAADSAGQVFVAGADSRNVFRVDTDGGVHRVIDVGPGGPIDFAPEHLVIDRDGVVFAAGRFDRDWPSGMVALRGDGSGSVDVRVVVDENSGLETVAAMAAAPGGGVLVATWRGDESGNAGRIAHVAADGTIEDRAAMPFAGAYLAGFAADAAGNVHWAVPTFERTGLGPPVIVRVDVDGTVTSRFGSQQVLGFADLTVDRAGELFFIGAVDDDPSTYHGGLMGIHRMTSSGRLTRLFATDDFRIADSAEPSTLRVDSTGALLVGLEDAEVVRVAFDCPPRPADGCLAGDADGTALDILHRERAPESLAFTWKGARSGVAAAAADVALCIYEPDGADTRLVADLTLAADARCGRASCWKRRARWVDRRGRFDGVRKLAFRTTGRDRLRLSLRARGSTRRVPNSGLCVPPPPVDVPLVVQLHVGDDVCREATFAASAVRKNDAEAFRAGAR